eukprot:TRINITY_DN64575_c0_g2_i1.p1 TRINITY_DN64575_c0_g2~~TRINITY_DN64575_c0_g2_i1.p1  ORF type:complete len:155 (-),score=10.19 TRINITY_DN64575_c0_g2_i1:219-662(-)
MEGGSLVSILPFIKLFLTALHQLPEDPFQYYGTVYRGECGVPKFRTPAAPYTLNDFTSFTKNAKVLERFLTTTTPRTLVVAYDTHGYDISCLSKYPAAEEVIIEPISVFTTREQQMASASSLGWIAQENTKNLYIMQLDWKTTLPLS